jgi:hypothetical protein
VGGKPDIEAPLSRWDQAATFTSLSDCSDERDRQLKNAAREAQQIGGEHEHSSDFSESDQFFSCRADRQRIEMRIERGAGAASNRVTSS